jgi:hypothetical protein
VPGLWPRQGMCARPSFRLKGASFTASPRMLGGTCPDRDAARVLDRVPTRCPGPDTHLPHRSGCQPRRCPPCSSAPGLGRACPQVQGSESPAPCTAPPRRPCGARSAVSLAPPLRADPRSGPGWTWGRVLFGGTGESSLKDNRPGIAPSQVTRPTTSARVQTNAASPPCRQPSELGLLPARDRHRMSTALCTSTGCNSRSR